jgi:Cdc6-like AAA superfamily ATPase
MCMSVTTSSGMGSSFSASITDISGVPGTGKTATVHAVVRELRRMAENGVRSADFHILTILTESNRKQIRLPMLKSMD